MRLVPKGWQVPVQIIRDQDGIWQVIANGEAREPNSDPILAGVSRVWESATMIDQAEYDYLIAVRDHARAHDPDHPAADPTKPIRVALLRPIHPRGHHR